ncbi:MULTISPECIES: helix-turn-helix domain-containing protein [Priestia]|uniref:helix-turn-helix domain-containing protein n=1 Tax=Priestia TaxID=2800373 RepID=UPI000BEF72FB|nr:helix-turn-helix transcriptional regulator [Priestia aryabhattai]PEI57461.1 XRE family transcriptional regulator [Priestia aryabhattai]
MSIEWKLRQVMAKNEIWSGSELARRMEEKTGYKMSAPSISALLNEPPKQMKITTLDALCSALNCRPDELLVHTPSYIGVKKNETNNQEEKKVVNSNSNRKLPPI